MGIQGNRGLVEGSESSRRRCPGCKGGDDVCTSIRMESLCTAGTKTCLYLSHCITYFSVLLIKHHD